MLELPETRNSLLVRLSAVNDTTAWAAFLRIYEPTIYRIARSRGLQDSDARDVTQEVLLAVHDKIDDWEYDSTKGSFRGWLFRVIRNLTLKSLSEKARRPNLVANSDVAWERPAPLEADSSGFLLEYRRQVFQWAARSIRSRFQSATWQAFLRTGIGAESAGKVASDLDMSVGAVYAAKCRVMAQLRDLVDQLSSVELAEIEEPSDDE